jgi:hypothetical protein
VIQTGIVEDLIYLVIFSSIALKLGGYMLVY